MLPLAFPTPQPASLALTATTAPAVPRTALFAPPALRAAMESILTFATAPKLAVPIVILESIPVAERPLALPVPRANTALPMLPLASHATPVRLVLTILTFPRFLSPALLRALLVKLVRKGLGAPAVKRTAHFAWLGKKVLMSAILVTAPPLALTALWAATLHLVPLAAAIALKDRGVTECPRLALNAMLAKKVRTVCFLLSAIVLRMLAMIVMKASTALRVMPTAPLAQLVGKERLWPLLACGRVKMLLVSNALLVSILLPALKTASHATKESGASLVPLFAINAMLVKREPMVFSLLAGSALTLPARIALLAASVNRVMPTAKTAMKDIGVLAMSPRAPPALMVNRESMVSV